GTVGAKLFTLKFKRETDIANTAQDTLYDGLETDDLAEWQNKMLEIVEKIYTDKVYEFYTVVTFIKGEYIIPIHKHVVESNERTNYILYFTEIILARLNKTYQIETSFTIDYFD